MFRTEVEIAALKTVAGRDTADGSPAEMPVFVARPKGGSAQKRPAILLIQEVFGVNPHIQDVCKRFAAAGYVVAAPDIFYRSEPWLAFDYTSMDPVRPHLAKLNQDLVVGDMKAALDFLAAQPDVDPDRIGSIGYCFGGRASLLAAIQFPERIKAAGIYYGGGIVADDPSAAVHHVDKVKCPVIAFFGALDKHIPETAVRTLESALTEAGVPNTVYYYPYADHGFFCDARANFHPRAAEDAWVRTLRFFEQNLGPVPEVSWQG